MQVLCEIEENPRVSQRLLSKRLGVALGLTNLYLRRLARKGYIKVTTIPSSRIRYLLTPRGMAEKTRLTYEFIQYSLTYYRDARRRFRSLITDLERFGVKKVAVFGNGELAELAYVSLMESKLELVGFIAVEAGNRFLSFPCCPPDELQNWEFDAILLSDLQDVDGARALLRTLGVPDRKVFSIVKIV